MQFIRSVIIYLFLGASPCLAGIDSGGYPFYESRELVVSKNVESIRLRARSNGTLTEDGEIVRTGRVLCFEVEYFSPMDSQWGDVGSITVQYLKKDLSAQVEILEYEFDVKKSQVKIRRFIANAVDTLLTEELGGAQFGTRVFEFKKTFTALESESPSSPVLP